jgi:hypothetical protein
MAMSYRARQQALGVAAHAAVEVMYRASHFGHHLVQDTKLYPQVGLPFSIARGAPPPPGRTTDRLWPDNTFRKNQDPYLSWLQVCLRTRRKPRFPLEPSEDGHARRPDVADVELHHLYEVKPDNANQVNKGRKQWLEFHELLTYADKHYVEFRDKRLHSVSSLYESAGHQPWRAGPWCPPPVQVPAPEGGLTWLVFRPLDGLLLWHEEDLKEPLLHDVPLELLVLGAALTDAVARARSEQQAKREAERLLQQQPELVARLRRLAALLGAAFVIRVLVRILTRMAARLAAVLTARVAVALLIALLAL